MGCTWLDLEIKSRSRTKLSWSPQRIVNVRIEAGQSITLRPARPVNARIQQLSVIGETQNVRVASGKLRRNRVAGEIKSGNCVPQGACRAGHGDEKDLVHRIEGQIVGRLGDRGEGKAGPACAGPRRSPNEER